MTDPNYTCAVCPKTVWRGDLMCYSHWYQVPIDARRRYRETLGNLKYGIGRNTAAARAEFLVARQAAIDAVKPACKAQAHYPEEWGPSHDRRLTCVCGNSDPNHERTAP